MNVFRCGVEMLPSCRSHEATFDLKETVPLVQFAVRCQLFGRTNMRICSSRKVGKVGTYYIVLFANRSRTISQNTYIFNLSTVLGSVEIQTNAKVTWYPR